MSAAAAMPSLGDAYVMAVIAWTFLVILMSIIGAIVVDSCWNRPWAAVVGVLLGAVLATVLVWIGAALIYAAAWEDYRRAVGR